jgi:hypothetical protein
VARRQLPRRLPPHGPPPRHMMTLPRARVVGGGRSPAGPCARRLPR